MGQTSSREASTRLQVDNDEEIGRKALSILCDWTVQSTLPESQRVGSRRKPWNPSTMKNLFKLEIFLWGEKIADVDLSSNTSETETHMVYKLGSQSPVPYGDIDSLRFRISGVSLFNGRGYDTRPRREAAENTLVYDDVLKLAVSWLDDKGKIDKDGPINTKVHGNVVHAAGTRRAWAFAPSDICFKLESVKVTKQFILPIHALKRALDSIVALSKADPTHKQLLAVVENGHASAENLLQTVEFSSKSDGICFHFLLENGNLGRSRIGKNALIMQLPPPDEVAVQLGSVGRLRFTMANIPMSCTNCIHRNQIIFIRNRPVVVAQYGYNFDIFAIFVCDQSWDDIFFADMLAQFRRICRLGGRVSSDDIWLYMIEEPMVPPLTVRLVRIEIHLTAVQHCLDCLGIDTQSWYNESKSDGEDEYDSDHRIESEMGYPIFARWEKDEELD